MIDQREYLKKLAFMRMPYGKYKGWLLVDIPEPYYTWYRQKGFPEGSMGMYLQSMYEIKLNGLEYLIRKIISEYRR
nr:DUF3820 family protein [Robertkochia marina]